LSNIKKIEDKSETPDIKKFVDHNWTNGYFEDLKKNFTTYQKSGVDAGTVLNKLIKQKTSMATTQPGWGDKVINFLKSFLLGG